MNCNLERKRMISPDAGALTPDDIEMLGALYEMEHWKVFRKYQEIERWAYVDNGLIQAKDVREVGEIQGAVGRINKETSDMYQFFTEANSIRKKREQETKVEDLADEIEEVYDENTYPPEL